MENILLEKDLSDEDEEEVLRSIALQRSLISKSQSLIEGISCDCLPPASDGQNNSTRVHTAIGVEQIENPYSDALAANLEYDRDLARLETSLKTLIAECKTNLVNLARDRNDKADWQVGTQVLGRGSYVFCFGAPFFKDQKFYACPPNADTLSKLQQDELSWIDLPKVRWWMPHQTKAMVEAIKKQSEIMCKQDAFREKNSLVRQCKALEVNSEERKRLEEEIQNFSIDSYVSSHLNEKIATIDHDWMQLSASVLNGKQSADECRAFWYNYLHPKYSKEKWTRDEDSKLRSLAKDNDCQDWDLIAEQLGTGRSGYQCFCQYKSDSVVATRRKWTKEEDKQLKAVVEKVRVGDYIPWGKVTIKGRSNTQVYNRWVYSLDPTLKKGKFSLQEDIIILRGIQKWGKNFTKIASFMPDRRPPQLRTRYYTSLSLSHHLQTWTKDEDTLLLDLVGKCEGQRKWSEMLEHFPGKSASKLRVRYDKLMRWERTNPGRPEREIVIRKNVPKSNIYTSHPEMWAYADQLLSGKNPNPNIPSVSLCAPIARPPKRVTPKESSIDKQLEKYFRIIYFQLPTKKFTDLPECDPVLIRDVAAFLELLGARLNIPSDGLDHDESLEPEDRQILKGLLSAHPKVLAGEIPEPGLEPIAIDEAPCTTDTASNINCDPPTDSSSTLVTLNFADAFSSPRPEAPSVRPRHPVFGHMNYFCPPNISTLIGLRTILLSKRELVNGIDTDQLLVLSQDGEMNEAFRRATELWEDRLMCLFALPNMLLKTKACDQQADDLGAGRSPLGVPLEDSGPGTSGVFDIDRTLVMGDGAVHVLTGQRKPKNNRSPKKTPKKRARKTKEDAAVQVLNEKQQARNDGKPKNPLKRRAKTSEENGTAQVLTGKPKSPPKKRAKKS